MTASNTPDQRIDEILDNALKQMRPVIKLENGTGIKGTDSAKLLLLIDLKSLFETMMAEVVGENQYSLRSLEKMIPTGFEFAQNTLRDDQRQRIPQVINKYFGGGE